MMTLLSLYPSLGLWFWPAAALVCLLPVYVWIRPVPADLEWNLRTAPQIAVVAALWGIAVWEIIRMGQLSALVPDAGETAFAMCARARDAGECAASLGAAHGWGARVAAALWVVGLDVLGMSEHTLRHRIGMSLSIVWLVAAAVPLWRSLSSPSPQTDPARRRWRPLSHATCAFVLALPFCASAYEHARLSDPTSQLVEISIVCAIDTDIAAVTDTLEGGHRLRAAAWAACARKMDLMKG